MDIKQILKYACFALCGAFLSLVLIGLTFNPENGRVVKREYKAIYTVTNYKTETNYYKISRVDVYKITNILDITNLTYIKKSNFLTMTNTLTITNIIEIFEDYLGFWESPFIFVQTNNIIGVQLYKRTASYYLNTLDDVRRHAITIYYPFQATYQYNIIGNFTIGAGVGYVNDKPLLSIGIGYQF